ISVSSGQKGSRSDFIGATDQFFGGAVAEARKWNLQRDWLATATARWGYAWDRWLIYTRGGIAATHTEYSLSSSAASTGLLTGTATQSETGADHRVGWTFGGGLELAISDNWSAMLEYAYADFGNKAVTTTGSITSVTSFLGFPP